jgi:hypothetical protein
MLTDTWRTHSSLSPRTGHRAAWPNTQRSYEAALGGCPNAQTLTLPSHHMRRRPGSALYRQSRWHGNCSLASMKSPYRSCSHPERGESCAKILARSRHGRYRIACIIFRRDGQAATRSLGERQAVRPGTLKVKGQRTVPPPWKRPARAAP